MEQLKVRKKDVLVMNLILHLALSFLFLYLQYAYRHHLSPFSMAYLRKALELFWYISGPILLTMILVWKHHKWAPVAFNFCVSLVSYKAIEGLFIQFNKIIVLALFCYIVISYFLYQLFQSYLSLASLNPNYSRNDLFGPLLKQIPCTLKLGELTVEGHLTNWDEEGCFVRLNGDFITGNRPEVEITFRGRKFAQEGEVVAHSVDLNGIGIKFGKIPKGLDFFNWSEFNDLVHELGYRPERLR